jgi:cobalt/nickel transport system permease protein
MLLHIGAVHLATDAQKSTVWSRLTPRSRLLTTLLFIFATALTPQGRWWTWGVYGTAIALLMLMSQVHLPRLLKRVAVEFIFIGVVIVGTLFRDGGDVMWQWGFLRITTEGLIILGSVASKALLSLLMVNILILTTPVSELLQALRELKMPPLLIAVFSSMYRYITVLMSNPSRQRTIIGNMIGSLFIRTFERGERVHQAMLARGYDGLPVATRSLQASRLDRVVLTLTLVVLLIGQAFYL